MKKVLLGIFISMTLSGMVSAGSAKDAWTDLAGERLSERPEFYFVHNDPALPNVLIYGDSISIGYTMRVREKLQNRANVYRIHCNGGDTERVIPAMEAMRETMAEYWSFKWDIIHFNVGLHDLKFLDENGKYDVVNGKQVHSIEAYKRGLKEAVEYFKRIAPEAKIFFATTTPVPENSVGRVAGDAAKYNKAALEVLESYPEIGINDLYGLSKPNHSKWMTSPGNVHYKNLGTIAQGDKVASTLLNWLEKKE